MEISFGKFILSINFQRNKYIITELINTNIVNFGYRLYKNEYDAFSSPWLELTLSTKFAQIEFKIDMKESSENKVNKIPYSATESFLETMKWNKYPAIPTTIVDKVENPISFFLIL